jgi:hypothetical protein
LALPHPLDPKTAALASSWLKQRERFEEAGVPNDAWLGDGPEVTVQAFSLAGEFHALSGPAGVAALAERAACVLGIREGPTSTRIRITPRGPQVIELAARLGSPAEVELARACNRCRPERPGPERGTRRADRARRAPAAAASRLTAPLLALKSGA